MELLHEPEIGLATPVAMPHPLTRDMLAWIGKESRTYAETMEAWRSSCPRLTIWEDALADDLVRVESAGPARRETVVLTPRGLAMLDGA